MDKEEEKRVVNKFTQQWALLKTVVVNSLEFFKGEFLKKEARKRTISRHRDSFGCYRRSDARFCKDGNVKAKSLNKLLTGQPRPQTKGTKMVKKVASKKVAAKKTVAKKAAPKKAAAKKPVAKKAAKK